MRSLILLIAVSQLILLTSSCFSQPSVNVEYGIIPWAVPDTLFGEASIYGELCTLKVVSTSSPDAFLGPGNFICLDFGGGVATYSDYISGNALEPYILKVGDNVFPELGNMSGVTAQCIQERLGRDIVFTNDATAWEEWLATGEDDGNYVYTPRIVVVPVIENPTDPNYSASDPLLIVGFAGFFVESGMYDQDIGVHVTGRFLEVNAVPEPHSLYVLFTGLIGVGGYMIRRMYSK